MGRASPRPDEAAQHPTIGVQQSSSPPVGFPAAKGQSEEASMALSETRLESSSKSSPRYCRPPLLGASCSVETLLIAVTAFSRYYVIRFSLSMLWHFPSKGLGIGRRGTQSVPGDHSSWLTPPQKRVSFSPLTELIFSNLSPNLVPDFVTIYARFSTCSCQVSFLFSFPRHFYMAGYFIDYCRTVH
jgi:hypothetical protein